MELSKKYKKIGEELIRKNKEFEHIKTFEPRIAYLSSDKEKHKGQKTVFAECRKVQEEYKWCCDYDFMIIVYEPNIIGFTDKQLRILIRHELMHVGIDTDGNEPKPYIVDHDIEDFRSILKRYGLDWNRS